MAKLRMQDAKARASNPVGRDFSEALARGMAVLTSFGTDARALTLSDISKRIDLPRATVRRSLLTLAHLGYLTEEGRQFRLTPKVLALAGSYLGASAATTVLQPICERLSGEYNETFSVAILDGADAVMIAYAMPRRFYVPGAGIGLRIPAFCSAVGRVLLAGLDADILGGFLRKLRPMALTPTTVTDKSTIRHLLRAAAKNGYALVEGEAEPGFRSLAVPVYRSNGKVGFALNVGMSAQRSSAAATRDKYLQRLQEVSADLQLKLF